MGNPFKQDFIEARMNAKLSPEKVQAMMDAKSRIYTAKFIHAGVCGYRQQNDITYLSRDVLYRMADSYLGRPVIVGHDLNITPDNIEEKMKGTVVRCYTNDGDDWYVDFTVTDPKVVKKIEEDGYSYVSCAYIITEKADEPEVHDGLECNTVVVNGFYHHLAITNSPRYDNTEIWRMNEDENIDLKKVGFSDIVSIESKKNSNKEKTMYIRNGKMYASTTADYVCAFVLVLIVVAAAAGYFMNLQNLFQYWPTGGSVMDVGMEWIVSFVGLFAVPIGIVTGWIF